MALKKDIVLDLRIANDEAINAIAQLTKRLDELKIKRLGLNAEVKAGTITQNEYYKSIARLDAEMKEVNNSMRMYQKELSRNIAEEKLETGSLDQMRAKLKQLTAEYDALSQTDREAIGGVGEQKLLEIRRLTEELTQAEQASGRFQRAVGSYEDAIKNALNGTIPMKQALRSIQTDLQTLTIQYRQSAQEIDNYKQRLQEIAATKGTESQEYKDTEAELQKLEKAYQTTGQTISEMTKQAGQLRDAMDDTAQSIRSAAADNAGIKAMTEGVQLLADGYTILKASIKTLGIESDSLMDIFAKLQIVQQACNAVSRISNALQKESILRQQAAIVWNKLTTTSIATLTAAKKADTTATITNTTATEGMAAAETTATAASGGLTVALKAVGTAIKSIPIIGWLAAAAAALTTIIALIYKANKAEKEGQELNKRKQKLLSDEIELRKGVTATVEKERLSMDALIGKLKDCKEGTTQWNNVMKQIADAMGVNESWLIRNKDKVEELALAWIKVREAMAMADAYTQKIVDSKVEQQETEMRIQQAVNTSNDKERKKLLKQLQDEGVILQNEYDELRKLADNLQSDDAITKKVANINIESAIGIVTKRLKEEEQAYREQLAEWTEQITNDTLKEGEKELTKITDDTAKRRIEAERQTMELFINAMQEGLTKQLAAYKSNMDKQIEAKRNQIREIQKAEKNASGEQLSNLKKAEAEYTKQMVMLTEQRDKKVAEINEKYSREQLDKELKNQIELLKIQISTATSEDVKNSLNNQIIKLQYEIDEKYLKSTIETLEERQKVFTELLNAPADVISESAKNLGFTTEQYIEYLKNDVAATQKEIDDTNALIVAKKNETDHKLKQQEADHQKKMADLRNNNASLQIDVQTAEALDALSQQMLANDAERELEKTRIKQEETQKRYELELQAYNNLVNLSEDEKSLLYDSHEAYIQATLEARKRVAEMHQQLVDSAKSVNQAQQSMVAQSFQTAEQVASAFGTVLSSISNLYNELASDNEEYNEFATGMAMAQIMISMAVSIAQAVAAAVQAGAFAGPAAPVTIPVFIAELVGIVASSIASAVSTLKQAEQAKSPRPRFAEGGLVGGKTTSGSVGRKDDVPILASRGEFIVNADATRKHLKELIAINNGIGNSNGYYADGGIVAAASQQEMDYSVMVDSLTEAFSIAASEIRPEVSVIEISKKQNRVKVKEQIAKQ